MRSLRTYFAALIGLFVVVAGVGAAYVHGQTERDARSEALRHATFSATSAAKQLADDLASIRASVAGVAAQPGIEKALTAPAGCSLSYAAGAGPAEDLGHFDIIRGDGTPVCSSRMPAEGTRVGLYGSSPWLEQARQGRRLVAPVLDPASGHQVAVIAAPIPDGGVVAGFVDLTAVGPNLAARYGDGGAVLLVTTGDRRKVLARSSKPERWIGTTLNGAAAAGAPDRPDLTGAERLYGEARVPGAGWRLAFGENKAVALAAQARLERRQLLIIGVGLLLILAAAAAIHRRVARPITQLGRELQAGARGGEPVPVTIPTACPSEVRSLAQDVNGLVASVLSELQGRKRATSALERSEETYRQLFERHPAPLFAFDLETLRYIAVNDAAIAAYGYSRDEFLEMTIVDIRPEEDRAKVREAVSDPLRGRVDAGVWRHVRKDGTTLEAAISSHDIEFDGRPARIVLAEDVTERNQLQRQLQQTYKMEALGQLAGGVAHDFNNLLTVISGFSVLALDSLSTPDAPASEFIREVQRAADRASDLTRQLLAYSRQQVLQLVALDLNRVVLESEALLRRVIGEDVLIATELADDLGFVMADEGQLLQVLMNLTVNARDAMPDGGTVTLRTRNAQLDHTETKKLWGAEPGDYVVLEVVDTGTGVDEETLEHLFEPFFTTKPVGSGTGLGLSTVFGIVKQMGGFVIAESTVGVGTTFRIYLPCTDARPSPKPETAPATGEGGETILVVEDEPTVRTLVERILLARGYTVLVTADAQEALRLSREHDIDAVVTDVVMPGMNGPDLVEELRKRKPHLRALFTSGYTSDAAFESGAGEELAFVQKPFTAVELAERLRELLDS